GRLTDTLLKQKREAEALSWAKLRWMSAPYETDPIDRASRLLVKVWSAVDPERQGLQGFAEAQKDSSKPNPLREVKLPPVDEKALQDRLAHLGSGAGAASERIALHIWMGAWDKAMLEAQKLLENKDTATQGALEAARTFKAHDLNLQRANAFLTWLKTKEGPNPIDEFLKEQANTKTVEAK
ncbi:MAG: hypothetical protein M3347_10455, partial [Armatimonadota bacterium]|nr:hypothetical protein [Armatimonadota bacterium]